MPIARKKQRPAVKQPSPEPAKSVPVNGGTLTEALVRHLGEMNPDGLISTGRGVKVQLSGVISTQCATLDAAIGRGGVPFGRLTVITGGEAGGKTTLCLHLAAEVQRMGGVCLYLDLEHKLDVDYADAVGVKVDELVLDKPQFAEEGFKHVDEFLSFMRKRSYQDVPILIVLDSINAATPKAIMDADYGDQLPAASARVFNQALSKLTKAMAGMKVALVMVSQLREKITSFGSYQEKISGGKAVKFYAAVVIDVKKESFLKGDGDRTIGTIVQAEIIKNQISHPFRKAIYHIVWGSGIDSRQALLTRAAELGIVNQGTHAWFEMPDPAGGEKPIKWQGTKGFMRIATERPELVEEIERRVREKFA